MQSRSLYLIEFYFHHRHIQVNRVIDGCEENILNPVQFSKNPIRKSWQPKLDRDYFISFTIIRSDHHFIYRD